MKRLNKNKIIITIFILCLTLPIIKINLDSKKVLVKENRNVASFPRLIDENGGISLSRYLTGFENWISDNIGYRDEFNELYTFLNYKVLGVDSNDKVESGYDDFLFYRLDNNMEIAYGKYPLSEKRLEEIKENQLRLQQKLMEQGIEYALVLPPSKVSVYPEKIRSEDCAIVPTPVDIVANYLENETDIKVIRLKGSLINAKEENMVYHKTDTHWNSFGTYVGYTKTVEELNKFGILENEPTEVFFEKGYVNGDLINMLNIGKYRNQEETLNYIIKKPLAKEVTEGEKKSNLDEINNKLYPNISMLAFENQNVESLKAILFGDSFGDRNFSALMAENFSEFVYVSSREIKKELIEYIEPDIVLFEVTERFINTIPDYNGNYIKTIIDEPKVDIISYNVPKEMKMGQKYDLEVTIKNNTSKEIGHVEGLYLYVYVNGADSPYSTFLQLDSPMKQGDEYIVEIKGFEPKEKGVLGLGFQTAQAGVAHLSAVTSMDVKVE